MTLILADMGIPMLFVQMPAMAAALAPIIILEALFLRARLAISYRDAFTGAAVANFVSTIFGIPFAWSTLVIPELIFEQHVYKFYHRLNEFSSPLAKTFEMIATFPWLEPDEKHLYWEVPVACGLLLIPSYFVSIWLERLVCCRLWPQVDSSATRLEVTHANRLSYAVLFVYDCSWLCYSILTHK